jgi:hypothetical protein
MDGQESYERAKKHVRQIKGFYIHAMIYMLVNALLIAVNLATSRGETWFAWPLLGWGIGLAAHGISVFGLGSLWGAEWEERKIKEIIERNQRR